MKSRLKATIRLAVRNPVLLLSLLVIAIAGIAGFYIAYSSSAAPHTPTEKLKLVREIFVVCVGTFAFLVAAHRMDWSRSSDSRSFRERRWDALEDAFSNWYLDALRCTLTCRAMADDLLEYIANNDADYNAFLSGIDMKKNRSIESLMNCSEHFATLAYRVRPISSGLTDVLKECQESLINLYNLTHSSIAVASNISNERANSIHDDIMAAADAYERQLINYREDQSKLRDRQLGI